MTLKFDIRPWQAQALDSFIKHDHKDFLCVATPGAGKTTFSLVATRHVLAHSENISRVIIVVPSAHLREQWADAGAKLGLILDTHLEEFNARSHGLITTYQSVAANAKKFADISQNSFVIFDEIHHAGDEKTWGSSLLQAFNNSPKRLSLSGTPFRSDTSAIPFVRYKNEELIIDYEYGYTDALQDGGVVRPVHFTRLDGHMEWIDTDGDFNSFSFAETLDTSRMQQRLTAALDPKGNWLSNAISRAHAHLQYIRRTYPKAGGLVICIDHKHAKVVAKLLRNLGTDPTVVLSDDVDATEKILRYSNSDSEWIVAVRMVSEGVDIPRLSVGLFATTTTTELFFRQAIGRIVRVSKDSDTAMMFIPNDPRIVIHAQSIAESRVHSLRKPEESEQENPTEFDRIESNQETKDDQLSMFEVVNSTPLFNQNGQLDLGSYNTIKEKSQVPFSSAISIELPPLPSDEKIDLADAHATITSMKRNRAKLRQQNNDRVRVIAQLTGQTHAQVNAELNKRTGISSILKASNKELEKRVAIANDWVVSFRKKRVS